MSLVGLIGQSTVIIQQLTSSRDAAGGVVNTWSDLYTGVKARIEDASAQRIEQFARIQLNITHEMFTQQKNLVVGQRVKEQINTLHTAQTAAAKTASFNGDAVDMDGEEYDCTASQVVTAVSGTTPTLAGKFQESDDGVTDWTNITGGAFPSVAFACTQTVRFTRSKRYLRYVGTIAGTSPSFTLFSEINPPRYYLIQSVSENRATGRIPFYAEVMVEEQRGLV